MTVDELMNILADYPLDYEVDFSVYFTLMTQTGDLVQIDDDPVIAIAESEESKKIRFVTERSNPELIDLLEDDIEILL